MAKRKEVIKKILYFFKREKNNKKIFKNKQEKRFFLKKTTTTESLTQLYVKNGLTTIEIVAFVLDVAVALVQNPQICILLSIDHRFVLYHGMGNISININFR